MSKTAGWSARAARKSDKGKLGRFVCNDPRLLLVFDDASKELVGLAAHERAEVTVPDEGVVIATKIEVAAIARAWQGKQLGSGKVRVSDAVMTTLMNDIQSRPRKRSELVFAKIHQDNARSIALCKRYGLIRPMSRPATAPDYIRLVT